MMQEQRNRVLVPGAWALALLPLLVACQGEPAQLEQWRYACAAQALTVENMGAEQISIETAGQRYLLQAAAAASGSRYSSADQQVEFWSKGQEATFTVQGNQAPLCVREGYLPSRLQARGHEPFWQIQLHGTELQLTRSEQQQSSTLQALNLAHDQPYQWLLQSSAGWQLQITEQHCQDRSSGVWYPYQAQWQQAAQSWRGCAGEPQRLLAGSAWQLVGSSGASLMFGAERSVSGFTGCNSLRGSYRLDDEGFRMNPLAVTRKACENTIMAAEHDYLRRLLEVDGFAFDSQGRLLLSVPGADPLVFEKQMAVPAG